MICFPTSNYLRLDSGTVWKFTYTDQKEEPPETWFDHFWDGYIELAWIVTGKQITASPL